MPVRPTRLDAEPAVTAPGILCLTGGGGKTTLLFMLGRSLAAQGHGVIVTTTTRMFRPRPTPWLSVTLADDLAGITAPEGHCAFAARTPPPGGDAAKVHGYAPEEVDALHRRSAASHILVEADGAAGRPLKAPAEHEPVIPGTTRSVMALIGLSCFLNPFGPETVFRPERVSAITGLGHGDAIPPEAVAALITHPEGLFKNTPPGAARLVFCNQTDLPGALEAARSLAAVLGRDWSGFLDGLYVGSLQQEGLLCRKMPEI